jgi:hypothetical protein
MIIRFPAKAQGPRSRRPELDLVNPPGQTVNPIPESLLYKPVHGGYAGSLPADTEEMFTPSPEEQESLKLSWKNKEK